MGRISLYGRLKACLIVRFTACLTSLIFQQYRNGFKVELKKANMPAAPLMMTIRRLTIAHKEATIVKAQKVVTIINFKVTICLYLSPNIRARSMSTLMAVIVIKDTEYNTEPVM